MIQYGIRKYRGGGWSAFIEVRGPKNERIWRETQGLPFVHMADAISHACWAAEQFAPTHAPRPMIRPTPRVRQILGIA